MEKQENFAIRTDTSVNRLLVIHTNSGLGTSYLGTLGMTGSKVEQIIMQHATRIV